MDQADKVAQASIFIPAEPETVFEVLADPDRHAAFDGTDMVGRPVSGKQLTRTGQVFTMNMAYADGEQVERYRTDNHVLVYDPPRTLAWATATVGGERLGWVWRYDLQPIGDGTEVTLTYDWSDASAENVDRYDVPLAGTDELSESLRRLAALVTTS